MSESSVKIRVADKKDREELYDLIHELGYSNLQQSEFDKTFDEHLLRRDLWVLIAEETATGKILGLASMSERPQLRLAGPLVTIDEFVISEQARGMGIGALLLEEAKRQANSFGASRLQLDTNRQRESYQRRFYNKNGFTEADSAVMRLEFSPKDKSR